MASETFRLETADGTVISKRIRVAEGFGSRFMGLMGKTSLDPDEGLCIQKCNSIHMFFMRIPIDVAFVNGDGEVLRVYNAIKPWRVSGVIFGSKAAIELPAGTLARSSITKGSVVKLESNGTEAEPRVQRGKNQ
jgi:uncharacterized membrane protein (UPF0127 family)